MVDPPSPSPGPGYWLASDGKWYPPQAPTPPPMAPIPPPQPSKSGSGCLIGLVVGGVVLLVFLGIVGFVIYKVTDAVEDVADGITVGDVECPKDTEVSDLIGHKVDLVMSGNIGVAAGCNYTGRGAGAGVAIVSGSGLIADEILAELETEAEANGAEVISIDVGDDGKAFGSPSRSEAATKDDGNIVQVEIFAEGTDPIGDKRDEAVEILTQYVELND